MDFKGGMDKKSRRPDGAKIDKSVDGGGGWGGGKIYRDDERGGTNKR